MVSRDQGQGSTRPQGQSPAGGASAPAMAQEKAAEMKDQVQAKAGEVKEQVAAQATSRAEQGKGQAVESLGSVASAVRQTGGQLRKQDQDGLAEYVERAAGRIEEFGAYLGNRNLNQLVGDAEQFARREPALFVGGSFLLGLFGARFLKSSAQASGQQAGAMASLGRGGANAGMLNQAPPRPVQPAYPGQTATGGMSPGSTTPTGASGMARGSSAAAGGVIVGGPPIDDVVVGGPPVEKPAHERRLAAFDQGREKP